MKLSFRISMAFCIALVALPVCAGAQSASDYDALVRQGNTQLQAGNNNEALVSANAAIKVNVNRWEAYAVAGGALMNLKRSEEAADQFGHAIDHAPDAKQAGLRELRKQCLLANTPPPGAASPLASEKKATQPPDPKEGPSLQETITWIEQRMKAVDQGMAEKNVDLKINIKGGSLVFHTDGDPDEQDMDFNDSIPIQAIDLSGISDSYPPFNPAGSVVWIPCKNGDHCLIATFQDNSDVCSGAAKGQAVSRNFPCVDSYHDPDGKPQAPEAGCDLYGHCKLLTGQGITNGVLLFPISKENTSPHMVNAVRHLVGLLQQESQSDLF